MPLGRSARGEETDVKDIYTVVLNREEVVKIVEHGFSKVMVNPKIVASAGL